MVQILLYITGKKIELNFSIFSLVCDLYNIIYN
jgi:hypothetical protein